MKFKTEIDADCEIEKDLPFIRPCTVFEMTGSIPKLSKNGNELTPFCLNKTISTTEKESNSQLSKTHCHFTPVGCNEMQDTIEKRRTVASPLNSIFSASCAPLGEPNECRLLHIRTGNLINLCQSHNGYVTKI